MKARPEFFGWTSERQELWRISMPADDRACFEEALLEELFGRTFATRADAVEAVDQLSLAEQNLWNETVLPLHGLGEDCFFLNEVFEDRKAKLDFETVRDYDESDYLFQESVRKEEDPGYSGRPYRGSLYLSWARLFVDGRFTYATLTMAAGYVYAQLHDAASDLIEQRIPHRYVPGPNHGRVEGECWEWDMRLDADGQEGILKELERRVWRYERDRWDALLSDYDDSGVAGVYLLDESEDDEAGLHVVFTDKRALSAVRFRSFMRDCRAIERPASEIEGRLEPERAAIAAFIEEQYTEIRRTFDPKVTRLEKRNKIMVNKDAF